MRYKIKNLKNEGEKIENELIIQLSNYELHCKNVVYDSNYLYL